MRVLWVGDAGCPTGFARCTHAVCDNLHANGHEVHILGLNHYGGTALPDTHFPYPIYSAFHPWDGGETPTRLPLLVDRLKPDVVIMLNDPWNIPSYQHFYEQPRESGHRPLYIAWLAVDSYNQKAEHLNRLDHVVTWTQFAVDELRKGGYQGTSSIVGLGVDSNLFHPLDKLECRRQICPQLPPDSYIVGYVGRNQPRKRIDLLIEYFAEWLKSTHKLNSNVYLLLHLSPTGEMGCDVESLSRWHGVGGKILVSRAITGQITSSQHMPMIYNAMDTFLTTSQAEGWCLPVLEAMACGVPCVVPAWAGLDPVTGWVPQGSVLSVPCTTTALTGPTNAVTGPWTIGGVMDKAATVDALELMYHSVGRRQAMIDLGFKVAKFLSWERCGEEFRHMLEEVVK